ncbi:hypothetical protein [Sphingomonas sp. KR3-1]|uniref:hypothetical protein n=1 Tax=Sphingomonas sp. KR3-1 TaxID=3156611 RepID=UPI0032B3F270
MSRVAKFSQRFQDLDEQFTALIATKYYESGSFAGDRIDDHIFTGWKLKVRHLLSAACGTGSAHYADFVERENSTGWSSNYSTSLTLKAVFDAAREDYEGGYLSSVRGLVQAELFDSELDQSAELLKGGYKIAAAVIAGVVLETTLRQLCDTAGIAPGNLNKMNADLAKAQTYSLLTQKRITALADIRNSAAHGYADKFNDEDVKDMIAKVGDFVTDHIG